MNVIRASSVEHRTAVLAGLWIAAVGILQASSAPAQTADDARLARQSLDRFFTAWNQADDVAVRASLNFPHLTLVNDRMIVANTPEEFTGNFERMRRNEDWKRSSLDEFSVTATGKGKVHCLVTYSRYDTEDRPYRRAKILYVVTEKEGHWGMQFRMPLEETIVETPEIASDESRRLLDEFFVHFNGRDNDSLQSITSFPHAFLLNGGRVALSRQAGELVMNFDGMTEREGWHRSSLDSVKLVGRSENNAAYEIVFGRHHADGSRYRTVPALWIVTRQDGDWGLQFRSLMPATLSR